MADTDTTADYRGHAQGLSYLETEEGNEMQHKSGYFKAKVELTATFASAPKLSGKVYDFEGYAVGEDWEVTFAETGLESNGLKFADTDTDMAWQAIPFGEEGSRPTGFYGDFWKHFAKGRAAGVFAATKQ